MNFVDRIHANRAIETMNFDLMEGQAIQVVRSERNPLLRKTNSPNIFVKNLDVSVTSRELFFAFSQFGNVISSKGQRPKRNIKVLWLRTIGRR